MAAGAILPPLFFERRWRCEPQFCEHVYAASGSVPAAPFLRDVFEKPAASISCLNNGRRVYPTDFTIERSLPKDI
jgi:hypothetical protein